MNAERLLQNYEQIADAPDAIARLRRFILDLAVRGKLVPQDPADEPASELLKRIAAERAILVQGGELREAREYNLQSGVERHAPNGWTIVPLARILKRHVGGGTPSKNDSRYWGGDILWASVKDVGKSKYLDRTVDRITDEGLANSSSNLIPPDNLIIVTRMGLGQLSINRVPVAINQDLRALFLSSFLSIEFVYNFFLTHQIDGTGLTVKGIKLDQLLVIPFPLPPLAEQHRIVAKIDELMALCDGLEAARTEREKKRDRLAAASLARLNTPDPETFRNDARFALDALPALTARPDQIKRLRQTILNLAVRGKLVPQDSTDEPAGELLKRISAEKVQLVAERKLRRQKELQPIYDDTIPFDLGEGWKWAKADDVFLNITDGFHNTPSPVTDGYPYVTAKHIRPNKIDFENCLYVDEKNHRDLYAKTRVKRGDILIVNIGAGCGTSAMVDVDYQFSFKNVAVVNMPSVMNGKFILIFLSYYRHLIFDDLIKGGAQPFLGLGMLKEMLVPLPPLAEQHRIVVKVNELMALCDQLEVSLSGADETRKKLLDALLAEALAPVDIEVLQEAAE